MHALNPSKIRAYVHWRLALAALRANSSLSVRLARYNNHMAISRALSCPIPTRPTLKMRAQCHDAILTAAFRINSEPSVDIAKHTFIARRSQQKLLEV